RDVVLHDGAGAELDEVILRRREIGASLKRLADGDSRVGRHYTISLRYSAWSAGLRSTAFAKARASVRVGSCSRKLLAMACSLAMAVGSPSALEPNSAKTLLLARSSCVALSTRSSSANSSAGKPLLALFMMRASL